MPLHRSLAITGWGVISPIGIGRDDFTDAIRTDTHGFSAVGRSANGGAGFQGPAAVIPAFEPAKYLGAKGTRSMDRTTGMAVATVGMALAHSGVDVDPNRARIGIALGTSTGSIRSISEFTRETLLHERPYLVNPALFPNTVMNCAAGQCAIWHGLKGVNATLSAGHLSGLLALRYASLTLHRGYADVLVTGCVEEFCEESAWAWHHLANRSRPIGEGCTMLVVEKAERAHQNGRPVLAEVLACESAIYAGSAGGEHACLEAFVASIRRALARAAIDVEAIDAISVSSRGAVALDTLECEAIGRALGTGRPRRRIAVAEYVGDTFSASAGFQLAAVLSLFEIDPTQFRHALITCIGEHGTLGCAILRNGAS
jgi:3-oxoacyl-[acyl-carrier-protein] synthase II